MKQHPVFVKVLVITVITLLVVACNSNVIVEQTMERTATSTPIPTNTATLRPTSTPRPTATFTPTPAPAGVPVANSAYEVNVIKVRKLPTVYSDRWHYWYAKTGYLLMELGVKVTNLKVGTTVRVPWRNISVKDSNGIWNPYWGGFRPVESGLEIDPASLSFAILEKETDQVVFDEDVYLRLIWPLADLNPSIVFFSFDGSPMIEVMID